MNRRLVCALLCLMLAAPAFADEDPKPATGAPTKDAPTRDAPAATPKGIAPTLLAIEGTPTGVATDVVADGVLVLTQEAQVVRFTVGKGVTWQASLGEHAADRVAASPRGDVIVASTALEFIALGAKDGKELWRGKRPVAFGFHADGSKLVTVAKNGAIADLDPTTGKEIATRQAGDRREVAMASLHPASGLAVLGVADG